MIDIETLPSKLATIDRLGSGKRVRRVLETDGPAVFDASWERIDERERQAGVALAADLHHEDVELVTILDDDYPVALRDLESPPPFLFVRGNRRLLDTPGLGVCGSRTASARGLTAVKACAERAVQNGRVIVSGYARGVDTEAHIGALAAGGETVIVLPEGIAGFRVKRSVLDVFDWDRVLVVSQFAPRQPWSVGSAMARNGTIVALSDGVLAVEAGDRGGTLNAGRQGLAVGRNVATLDFSGSADSGSSILNDAGAVAIGTPADFERFLGGSHASKPLRHDDQLLIF